MNNVINYVPVYINGKLILPSCFMITNNKNDNKNDNEFNVEIYNNSLLKGSFNIKKKDDSEIYFSNNETLLIDLSGIEEIYFKYNNTNSVKFKILNENMYLYFKISRKNFNKSENKFDIVDNKIIIEPICSNLSKIMTEFYIYIKVIHFDKEFFDIIDKIKYTYDNIKLLFLPNIQSYNIPLQYISCKEIQLVFNNNYIIKYIIKQLPIYSNIQYKQPLSTFLLSNIDNKNVDKNKSNQFVWNIVNPAPTTIQTMNNINKMLNINNQPVSNTNNKTISNTNNHPILNINNKTISNTNNHPILNINNKTISNTNNKTISNTNNNNQPISNTNNQPISNTNNKTISNTNTNNQPILNNEFKKQKIIDNEYEDYDYEYEDEKNEKDEKDKDELLNKLMNATKKEMAQFVDTETEKIKKILSCLYLYFNINEIKQEDYNKIYDQLENGNINKAKETFIKIFTNLLSNQK